jgi:hypothetical protein
MLFLFLGFAVLKKAATVGKEDGKKHRRGEAVHF